MRVAGTTRRAEGYQVQELILTGSNRSFDQQVTEESITEEEVTGFCSRLHAYGEKLRETDGNVSLIPLRKLTASQLIAWKLIQRQGGILRPTNGYLLLNGQIGDHFDEPYVQCAVFKGTTKSNFITHREFHGPLYEQIEHAYNFVLQYIKIIPEINGLVRRDFYEILWFPRRMDNAADQTDAKTIQPTDQKTDQSIKLTNKTDQTIQPTDQSIKPTNKTDQTENTGDKEKRLLALLTQYPQITQKAAADKLGWKLGMTKYHFARLQDRGVLRRTGNHRIGVWQIIAKEDPHD